MNVVFPSAGFNRMPSKQLFLLLLLSQLILLPWNGGSTVFRNVGKLLPDYKRHIPEDGILHTKNYTALNGVTPQTLVLFKVKRVLLPITLDWLPGKLQLWNVTNRNNVYSSASVFNAPVLAGWRLSHNPSRLQILAIDGLLAVSGHYCLPTDISGEYWLTTACRLSAVCLSGKLLLVLGSTVILGFESRGTQDSRSRVTLPHSRYESGQVNFLWSSPA
jgi:hypothetical protein